MDYFLTDIYAAPLGEEAFFSEKLLRLPESQISCLPPKNAKLYALPAPVLEAGYLTFGVLARWEKVTDEALAAWAKILSRVKESRLLVQDGIFSDERRRAEALARMEETGMDTSCVDFVPWTEEYILDYERVDIALDTFPRTGRRSVCEALYMGIPVVARKGRACAERASESVLANTGINGLCADNWEAYVEAAVELAKDHELLMDLHLSLRRKIKQSAVMNTQRYMDALEEAYSEIFAAWERNADEKKQQDNLRRRLERFRKARSEQRWKEAAGMGSRLVFAGVNLPDSAVEVAETYYTMDDDQHCLYWMSRAEKLKPRGRTRLLAWLAFAQEKQSLLLQAGTTYRQMLYSVGSGQGDKCLSYQVWLRYGHLMSRLGRMDNAYRAFEESYHCADTLVQRAVACSSMLLAHNNDEISPQELFCQSKRYSGIFKDIKRYCHTRQRHEHARLRIGYVSPDFQNHVMFHFILPFWVYRNQERFEVYAYKSSEEKDLSSGLAHRLVDVWRDVDWRDPAQTAKTIYEDEIDILFDLAGHTGGSALSAFAWKPAPIQISGLGYMATTGLDTMDYFLTDAFVDPPGEHDANFTEKLIYVTTQFCYSVIGKETHPVQMEAPSKRRGWVLFGVFNRYKKVTDEMLLAWKEILYRVPRSKLLLKSDVFGSIEVEEAAYQRLKALGFPMERVLFEPATKTFMERYLDVDIALDTYPWPGGGTTCDALYMGVPVVTRYGERRSTRFSYGLLQNIGLGELAAVTVNEYVEKAIALALDEELLDALHKNLRTMMKQSPLMNAARYIREVEAQYEEIWEKWKNGEA